MSIEDNNRESLGEENHKNSEVLRSFKEVLVGLPIFLIPLFTFLSPANLKQLASGQISPILISLSIFFVFLFNIDPQILDITKKNDENSTNIS